MAQVHDTIRKLVPHFQGVAPTCSIAPSYHSLLKESMTYVHASQHLSLCSLFELLPPGSPTLCSSCKCSACCAYLLHILAEFMGGPKCSRARLRSVRVLKLRRYFREVASPSFVSPCQHLPATASSRSPRCKHAHEIQVRQCRRDTDPSAVIALHAKQCTSSEQVTACC